MRLKSILTHALAIGIIIVIPARASATAGVLPIDGDTLNYTHVLFQWAQQPGAVAYQLQVAIFDTTGGADPFAGDPLVDIVDSTTLAIVTDSIDWAQDYTWRIRSINAAGVLGDWGEANNFVVDSLPGTTPDYIITINDTTAYHPGLTMTNLSRDAVMLAVDMLGEPVFFVEWGTRNIHLAEILPNGNFLTTPVEITLDNEVLWEPPEAIHHGIISLPNGNFMALGREDQWGPIPEGPWSVQYDTAGIDSLIWQGDLLIEWDHDGIEIWRWSVFDHFSMTDYDSIDFTLAFDRGNFDWTHSNALSYDPVEDAIYVSVRHMDRITKIDHSTGDVIWNMGKAMPSGDTRIGNDLDFSHTHAIEYLGNGRMILYDNGNRADPQRSRGLEIVVTETALDTTAEIVWEYVLPDSLYTQSQGDCDRLPNGNYLITAANPTDRSINAHIFELTPDNNIVWSLRVGATGNRAMYASERFPGLYPQAFSMIQPALATGIATPTIFVPSGAASLQFKLFNEGYMAETYAYEVIDSYGWFEDNGEIELAPGGSGMFTVNGTVSYDMYPNIVQVTVTPLNAPAREVVYQYEVYSQLPQAIMINGLPDTYAFDAAYPNPFNPTTYLKYALPTAGQVSLVIYDIGGREVVHLIDEYQPAGLYKSAWNAGSFASGIYFARFKTEGFVKTRKLILMK